MTGTMRNEEANIGGGGGDSLVLAYQFKNVPGSHSELDISELERGGWDIKDWKSKPGRSGHMLSADLLYCNLAQIFLKCSLYGQASSVMCRVQFVIFL